MRLRRSRISKGTLRANEINWLKQFNGVEFRNDADFLYTLDGRAASKPTSEWSFEDILAFMNWGDMLYNAFINDLVPWDLLDDEDWYDMSEEDSESLYQAAQNVSEIAFQEMKRRGFSSHDELEDAVFGEEEMSDFR